MVDKNAVQRYHERRRVRLAARGIREDSAQRLAFGLCKKYGINLPKGAGPQEAWEALKDKTGKGPMDFYAGSGSAGADKIRFSTASPKTFVKKLAEAKKAQDPKNGWRVTGLSKEELLDWHKGAKLHVTDGGSTIAIDGDDIVAVCVGAGDGKGGFQSGSSILDYAVKNGGKKLDSYSGNHKFYAKNGFEPVSWCDWDDDYAGDEWLHENGFTREQWNSMKVKPKNEQLKVPREPIVFYKYVGIGKVKRPDLDEFMKAVPAASDYDDAKRKRDAEVR